MDLKRRLERLEQKAGAGQPRMLVALETSGGLYQGSDGQRYTAPELDELAAAGVQVVRIALRQE